MLEFAIFPTDKGESVSEYISEVIQMISQSKVDYQLSPMGTIIETDTIDEALAIVKKSYEILEPHSERVYCSLKMDIRKGKTGRMLQKIQSIENKIGKIKTTKS